MTARPLVRAATVAGALILTATSTSCSADPVAPAQESATADAAPDRALPTSTEEPPDLVRSLDAIADAPTRGGDLRVTAKEGTGRQLVTYRSDGLRVSALLLRPAGEGPFPAVVIAHGRVPRDTYRTGDGFRIEQQALLAAGYLVLQVDYRGHANSDPLEPFDENTLVGYTRDTINAVATLRSRDDVVADRVALLGRSMGGGITMNVLVTHPDLVRAAVLLSPTSSIYHETEALLAPTGTGGRRQDVSAQFGSRADNPSFYTGLSAAPRFGRVTAPVLIQHGTADRTCPVAWSERTFRQMKSAGVSADLELYAGEGHIFGRRRAEAVSRAVDFLDVHLR